MKRNAVLLATLTAFRAQFKPTSSKPRQRQANPALKGRQRVSVYAHARYVLVSVCSPRGHDLVAPIATPTSLEVKRPPRTVRARTILIASHLGFVRPST